MSEAEPIRRKGITLGVQRRMSPDDLATEDGRVIEDNFPKHRTLHLKPNDGAIQRGSRIDIVVTEEVLLATAHHVARDTSKESGGFLLGNRYVCPNTNRQYIVIDQFMKADYTEGTQVSLTFTTSSWAQLKDRMSGKYLGKTLVGWYHSHPAMGIFLSNYDLDIHKNRFANEWDVALVLDPVKHEGGFFAWVEGNVNPREKLDFYELLDGDSRETVVAWTNYTAEDPKTGIPAPLKAVNTQNSDGNPATPVSTAPKKPTVTSGGGLLSNPIVLLGGAAVLALFLLGSLLAGYWLWKRSSPADSNSNTISSEKNKVLVPKRIKIENLKGYISSTSNEMTVKMQIKGIGGSDVIDEVRNENNLVIEINGLPTKLKSEVNNGVLEVGAVAIMPADTVENFSKGNEQDFSMRVEMTYKDEAVAKSVNTKFQKGKGKNDGTSLGDVVVFGDVVEENITPTRTPRPTDNSSSESVKPPEDKPQPATKKTTQKEQKQNSSTDTRPGTSGSTSLDSPVQPSDKKTTPTPEKPKKKEPKKGKQGIIGGLPF